MCRAAGVAIVFADSAKYPTMADVTGDFVYARLEDAKEEVETGYTATELDYWAKVAKSWAEGHAPDGLNYVDRASHVSDKPRDVFVFMINRRQGARPRRRHGSNRASMIERV